MPNRWPDSGSASTGKPVDAARSSSASRGGAGPSVGPQTISPESAPASAARTRSRSAGDSVGRPRATSTNGPSRPSTAGGWREATFAATDLLVADPTRLADALASDLDRFGRPRAADLTVLGNRGASGIDGITSSALGAGSATDDPLVLVIGDLAYLHDTNGLLAVNRFDLDATVVCINNDGGGIFHLLPIEEHESFDEWFRTPHGLDFEPTGELYGLEFARTEDREGFRELYTDAVGAEGTQVIEVVTDSRRSHDERRQLEERVGDAVDW